jgi:hypothetical protein
MALVGAVVAARRLDERGLRRALLMAIVLVAAIAAWVGFRLSVVSAAPAAVQAASGAPSERVDLLTFAQGANPVRIGGTGAALDGLRNDSSAGVVIEGHTSSEGTEEYNLKLSERRAQSVVQDLVTRGIAASRLQAVGAGEGRPLASNDDDSGRSLNRRVKFTASDALRRPLAG